MEEVIASTTSLSESSAIKTAGRYVLAAFLSLVAALIVLDVRDPGLLTYPISYEEDSIFYSMAIKSIITTGWYLTNSFIGAPEGYSLYDFPMPDGLSFFLIKAISYFTTNWALIQNLFFLLTFPLCSVTALFVLSRLGLKYPFALAGSLLYSMLPYHFMRGTDHLLLSAYFMIPPAVWLAVLVYQNRLFSKNESFSFFKKENVPLLCLYSALCLGIGSTGVYYAFFGCFFMLIGGSIASYVNGRLFPLGNSLVLISLIFLSVIFNLLPNFIYQGQYGSNKAAYSRGHVESEVHGLKIVQLILPIFQDRVKICAKITNKYYNYADPPSENASASLGLIGSAGFLLLIIRIFLQKKKDLEDRTNTLLNALAYFTLAGLLLATVGGFSSLMALLTPNIRAPNRISVYIAFFAISAFFIFAQNLCVKFNIKNKSILCLLLIIFGVYNQTSAAYKLPEKIKAVQSKFKKDAEFFGQIDNLLPPHSMIFQLPYMFFPESGPIHGISSSYNHFRGPLHTYQQKWSYGAIRGREVDLWQRKITAFSMPDMVDQIVHKGFRGLYINRKGYTDDGYEIENQLSQILKITPLVSEELSFWDLRSYASNALKEVDQY
jgi:phosphoglycerol transferase